MMTKDELLTKFPATTFIDHEIYHTPEIEAIIDAPIPGELAKFKQITTSNDDLARLLNVMCNFPLLKREQEQFLFKRLNYCRYKANSLREIIVSGGFTPETICEFERYSNISIDTRNIILNHNMKFVVCHLLKHGRSHTIRQRIGQAVLVTFRAIDEFEWNRGTKFSTLLTWVLFRKCQPWMEEHRSRLVTAHKNLGIIEGLILENFLVDNSHELTSQQNETNDLIKSLLTALENLGGNCYRMAAVLRLKFLDSHTLDVIGEKLGISGERVRTISIQGMKKIKLLAQEQFPSEFVKN